MDIYQEWSQLRKTTAHQIYERISDVILMSYIHLENFHNLQAELDVNGTHDALMKAIYDRPAFKKTHLKITQLLFNYISSAIAVRDSSRNLLKCEEMDLSELRVSSQRIIDEKFKTNPIVKLVEELRNVITHQSIISPSISSYMNINKRINIHGYAYSLSQLLEIERLPLKIRQYLAEEYDKYIFLLPLVEAYNSITSDYQLSLLSKMDAIHRNTYPEYWRVRNSVMSEWGNDTPLLSPKDIKPYITL